MPQQQAATLDALDVSPRGLATNHMIHSMTAFARESTATDQGDLTVELRSVNHRYLDCTFKLPDALRPLEQRLRELAGSAVARGKLDCFIRLQAHPLAGGELSVNAEQLNKLVTATDIVSARLPDARPPTVLEVLLFPGICAADSGSEEALQAAAEALFRKTVANLVENRRREGEKLAQLVLERLEQVELAVTATHDSLPTLLQQQHDRMVTRIAELDIDVDDNRLEQELVIHAVAELDGRFTLVALHEAFDGRISRRALTRLAQRWEDASLLTERPRRVTIALRTLVEQSSARDAGE